MRHICTDCTYDIRAPWDGELTDEPHLCAGCRNPVCWECKTMDENGEDWCDGCLEASGLDMATIAAGGAHDLRPRTKIRPEPKGQNA